MRVILEVSGRHAHISSADFAVLFGKNKKLSVHKHISQPGQFAAQQTIDVVVGKRRLKNVRIVGPVRNQTIVELSATDCYNLGIGFSVVGYSHAASAHRAAVATLIGPRGQIRRNCIIVAHRHLHCDPKTAKKLHLKTGQRVAIKTPGVRGVTFENVLVRVHPQYVLRLHLDTDEGNAAGIKTGAVGGLILK